MAHIHLEDGTFTLFWVLVWWLAALIILSIVLWKFRSDRKPDNRSITLAAFFATAAFVVFQIEIPVFGGVHLNLTPIIGILAGPLMGTLIVTVVNILSAAIGHGGWGLAGANILVNIAEVTVAWGVFRGMKPITGRLGIRAGAAAFIGLTVGNLVMAIIILVSGIQGVNQDQATMLSGLSLILGINLVVAAIEAVVTGLIVEYIARIRPDILA
jgi:cobalt/nickel transport system permease protein